MMSMIPAKVWSAFLASGLSMLYQGCRKLSGSSPFRDCHPPSDIFLLRTHAIGDVLLTTPVLRALKQFWPGTRLTMLVGDKSKPVLEGNPHLDALISFPESWWFEHQWSNIWQLTRSCRRASKEVLILFHASPLLHLWGWLIKARIRVGFVTDSSGIFLTHRMPLDLQGYRYMGEVNLDLIQALGVPIGNTEPEIFLTPAELETGFRFLQERVEGQWLVGVAPGGGQNPLEQISVKQWPASHYVQLLKKLTATQTVTVVLLGDRYDDQVDWIAQNVQALGAKVLNLKGCTSLRELAAVISHLDLLITNDSGPMHLAVALQTPVTALFGPTAAKALFPAGPFRTALQSPVPCSPCYPFGRFPGCPDPLCMAALPVDRVYQAVIDLMARLGTPQRPLEGPALRRVLAI
jgi:heptosyltransferase II